MPVQITCKFHKDPIKILTAMLRTRSNMVFFVLALNAKYSEVNSPILWEFELFRDFMPVLVTFKFEDDQSKVKALSFGQHFLHNKAMGKFFIAQGLVTPK